MGGKRSSKPRFWSFSYPDVLVVYYRDLVRPAPPKMLRSVVSSALLTALADSAAASSFYSRSIYGESTSNHTCLLCKPAVRPGSAYRMRCLGTDTQTQTIRSSRARQARRPTSQTRAVPRRTGDWSYVSMFSRLERVRPGTYWLTRTTGIAFNAVLGHVHRSGVGRAAAAEGLVDAPRAVAGFLQWYVWYRELAPGPRNREGVVG